MKMTTSSGSIPGSFRDPSGFLFLEGGSLYRQVNVSYKENYDQLMNSGFYETLVGSGLLIPHDEVSTDYGRTDDAYKVLRPELIPFISYPYEWCFSQLKDAALATLEIQRTALSFGMTLKDGSAYNIQFMRGKPVLIDTLSFEKYCEGKIWIAYRQFCQHFLAPLALMSYRDVRLNQLFRVYIDAIPLDLASRLIPFRTWLKFSLLSHIHLHARSQERFADRNVDTSGRKMSRIGLLGLIDNLDSAVRRLKWRPQGTEWATYYEDTSYSAAALHHKRQLVGEFLDEIGPESVWDLGANTGLFSRIAAGKGIQTISFDVDPAAVEKNYSECRSKAETNVLPLLLDLTNPSPNLGWASQERMSLLERGPTDVVLALALIHHLAISNNLPFRRIAEFFGQLCHWLIIEYVPKSDAQVQRLLATRDDIFPKYTQQAFEAEFSKHFAIRSCEEIRDTERTLFLMERRKV